MALTTVDQGLLGSNAQYTGFKNRIINGAMVIDQRNAGAEVNPAVNGSYYVDRWYVNSTAAGKFKIGQNAGSVTPPNGFAYYLGLTSISAYTVGAGEVFAVTQGIEGYNIADLNWGTSTAQPISISFWVRSSLTGTFGGALRNGPTTNRSYPFTYTINSANTWEYKTISVAGDTTTSTYSTTNTGGLYLTFSIGTGSTYSGTANTWQSGNLLSATGATSVVGTNAATFYITGVQLEKGSTATSFDYRPYGTELQLCQRYFYRQQNDGAITNFYALAAEGTNSGAGLGGNFPSPMRTVPVPTLGSGIRVYFPSSGTQTPSISTNRCSSTTASLNVTWTGTAATLGQAGSLYNSTTNAYIDYSAEL